jgi:5-methylcytosine-specific restriction endonuclease McrA
LKPPQGTCASRSGNESLRTPSDDRLNHPILGEGDDLEAFMFETPRQALMVIGDRLRRLLHNHCFYCGTKLHDADVDHFVPFSLYPRDLMHNFVLAHPECNRSKSDTLAARIHLEHWLDQITRHDDDLREIGEEAGRIADLESSRAVARWGYSNAASITAQAWVRAKVYETIDSSYTDCLA